MKGLEKAKKNRICIISSLIIMIVATGIFLLTRTSYITLIENADNEAIKSMQKVLDDKGISYKLTNDKSGIIVNKKDSDQAHWELVNAGAMKDGLVFADALGSTKINATESEDKKHIWQRLTEADIARQLKQFKNVKDADVAIAGVKTSNVKAAVTIIPNGEIPPKQVQKMTEIVAKSIEGLDAKNVTINVK